MEDGGVGGAGSVGASDSIGGSDWWGDSDDSMAAGFDSAVNDALSGRDNDDVSDDSVAGGIDADVNSALGTSDNDDDSDNSLAGGIDAEVNAGLSAAAQEDTIEATSVTVDQVGYGDFPGGVSFSDLDDLTEEDVAARIVTHLDAYGPESRHALDDALDLAVAYRAQGGVVDFNGIKEHPNLEPRDVAAVTVAERRADTLAEASSYIQSLNRNGMNYGAELYGTLTAISNAQPGPLLGISPDEAAAYSLMQDHHLQHRYSFDFTDAIKNTAFYEVMSATDYGHLLDDALRSVQAQEELAKMEMRRALDGMTIGERVQYGLGVAMDSGAPLLGMAMIGGLGRTGGRPATPGDMVARQAGTRFHTAPVNYGHIFHGEVRQTVGGELRAVGGHYVRSPNVRVVGEPRIDANGVMQARVEIRNPANGGWVSKRAESTFFPESWTQRRVTSEIEGAFRNSSPTGISGQWEGVSASGLAIRGYYARPDGSAATAFPVFQGR